MRSFVRAFWFFACVFVLAAGCASSTGKKDVEQETSEASGPESQHEESSLQDMPVERVRLAMSYYSSADLSKREAVVIPGKPALEMIEGTFVQTAANMDFLGIVLEEPESMALLIDVREDTGSYLVAVPVADTDVRKQYNASPMTFFTIGKDTVEEHCPRCSDVGAPVSKASSGVSIDEFPPYSVIGTGAVEPVCGEKQE